MTKRLREVVEALEKLPENEQNSIAEELVRKLEGAGGYRERPDDVEVFGQRRSWKKRLT